MSLTREQQRFLHVNFNFWHQKRGETRRAAFAAADRLEECKKSPIDDGPVRRWRGELAAQAVVLFRAAAVKESDPHESSRLIEHSLATVLEYYPIATTMEECQRRAQWWSDVFGEKHAYLWCLRDLIKLVKIIQHAPLSGEQENSVREILKALRVIAGDYPHETAVRILILEESTRKHFALWAFVRYLFFDGWKSVYRHPEEFSAVYTIWRKKMSSEERLTQTVLQPIDPDLICRLFALRWIALDSEKVQKFIDD